MSPPPSAEVVVREARPHEHAQVADLTVEAYREYAEAIGPEFWERYRTDLADVSRRAAEGVVLVAEDGGALVGAVVYYPPATSRLPPEESWRRDSWPRDWAYVRALGVHPSQRRRGIGRLLTEACVSRARADGAAAIGLNTTSLMTAAMALYERMGFHRRPEPDHGGERAIPTYVLPLA